jgi:hypothetical protein
MANPCSSGTAEPRDTTPVVVWITTASITLIIGKYVGPWLSTFASAVGDIAFDPDEFCQSGQPALPEITASDVLALLSSFTNPLAGAAGLKLRDLVLYYLWYELCQCVGGTTTPAADPQDEVPIGSGPADISPTVCATGDPVVDQEWNHAGSTDEYGPFFFVWGPNAVGGHTWEYPTLNVLKARAFGHKFYSASGPHDNPFTVKFTWGNVNLSTVIRQTEYEIVGSDWDIEELSPPGAEQVRLSWQSVQDNDQDTMSGNIEGFCAGVAGSDRLGCCPPDPNIAVALAQLTAQLELVKLQVDLIQRQGVPFGYVPGGFHSDLSGNDVLTFDDPVIGVKIIASAVPDDVGLQTGDEPERFTDSWVNFSSGGDRAGRIRITNLPLLLFPPAAGVFDQLSYSLRPGLTISVLELLREP